MGRQAYAPTSKNSTSSVHNADNMSRKSGFSKGFPLKSPRVEGELPHHTKTLGGCGVAKVWFVPLVDEFAYTNGALLLSHVINLLCSAHSAYLSVYLFTTAVYAVKQNQR
jgi:hypothetical protein